MKSSRSIPAAAVLAAALGAPHLAGAVEPGIDEPIGTQTTITLAQDFTPGGPSTGAPDLAPAPSTPPTPAQPKSTAASPAPAPAGSAPAAPPAPAVGSAPPATQPAANASSAPAPAPLQKINPYNRDIELTAPLNFGKRQLGELPVLLTRDNRFVVKASDFVALVNPLLNPAAKAELQKTLIGHDGFESRDIRSIGIELAYDPTLLSLVITKIDPAKREIESLFQGGTPEPPATPPNKFAAYLNGNIVGYRRQSTGKVQDPAFYLDGAMAFGHLVLETDIEGQPDPFGGDYSVIRRYARFVYDQPDSYRRWYAGDLDPQIRDRQGFTNMGGIGVDRLRRRFESYRPGVLEGDRNLFLQSDSTVRVIRNGVTVKEMRLDAGQYNLSNLPLQTGSNDIKIEVTDDAGRTSVVNYQSYLDAIDLDPGDYEYGAYLGATALPTFGSPDYSKGTLAFTGFYRKAFLNAPAVGVGIQASGQAQMIDGQTQFILRNGDRVLVNAAVSNAAHTNFGYAGAISYERLLDRGSTQDRAFIQLDYVSKDFATISNTLGQNTIALAVTASYSHIFNDRLYASVDATYQKGREGFGDAYRVGPSVSYRVTRTVSVQAGVDYAELQGSTNGRNGVGFNIGLVWQPRYDRRLDARYSSNDGYGSVSFTQSADNRVNSFGYSALVDYQDGPGDVSASADYIGNRFDATLTHTAYGQSFSSLTDEQITSLRVGSSIAFTGGHFAIGRRIGDSFAILYPHESLGDHRVIAGDDLERGGYQASSGVLGPALVNTLGSYVNQSLRYDVANAPQGYDIGDGIKRVRPSYRSGYSYQIGGAAFVSAMGTLVGEKNKPIALTSGRITKDGDPADKSESFFTNSVGRFAVQGLEPGKRYHVQLFTEPAVGFDFEVPKDNTGLLNLNTVTVPLVVMD